MNLVAPTKALCNEVYNSWRKKFFPYEINVALVTGDSDPKEMYDLNDLHNFQIAVTTPEKWDVMTCRWKDHSEIINAIKLFFIDEIHMVGDKKRGPTIEAIVSRAKSFPTKIRFIVTSASVPNIDDIAHWIGSMDQENSVKTFR